MGTSLSKRITIRASWPECQWCAATGSDRQLPDAVFLASVSLALLDRQRTSAAPPGPNSWKQAWGDALRRASAPLPEGQGGAETRLGWCACVRACVRVAPNPSGEIPNEPGGGGSICSHTP